MRLYAPWERAFQRIATPFEHFLHAQTTTGIILLAMTLLALIVANSPLRDAYLHFIHTPITLSIGSLVVKNSLHHWINDGLMAIFFFTIGLEIKREILFGQLASMRVAILPILAAIGGMLFPAVIYLLINYQGVGANGWGIPMATDIAFAISALVLLKGRIAPSLFAFLVAFAIVDDLGAVIVIALFYTATINLHFLFLSGIMLGIMVLFNRLGIRAILPYFLVGLALWFFMLESGVHATIAGVLAAMAIPSKPKIPPVDFTQHTKNLLDEYDSYPVATDHTMHENQKALLQNIRDRIDAVSSPAAKLENALHLPVTLIILPLFAFANAGIVIDFGAIDSLIFQDISLGVILGLMVGKMMGIFGVAYLSIKFGIAKLPEGSSMSQVFGVAALGGIGFTMSIFVADLAFLDQADLIYQAKIGILAASFFSGLFGYIWLRFFATKAT